MLVDTHAHFDHLDAADVGVVLGRAAAAGVARVLAIGSDPATNAQAMALAQADAPRVDATVGYGLDLAPAPPPIGPLRDLLARPEVVAIGEIGLDGYRAKDTLAAQQTLLREMLALAREVRRPVVVHSRDADEETLLLLEEHAGHWPGDPERIGVLHCFTGGQAFADRLLALGFSISFSGIVTFANAEPLRAVCRKVPEHRLLIETDAPYLAPVPVRGRTNEPAFLVHVAERVAAVRGTIVERIAEVTTRNATRLFGT